MATFQGGKLFGIGADLLAAVALTGVGVVFHAIVNKGSALALVEVLALAAAVMAILKLYLWALDKMGDDLKARKTSPMDLTPKPQQIDRAARRNHSFVTANENPNFERNYGGLQSRTKNSV